MLLSDVKIMLLRKERECAKSYMPKCSKNDDDDDNNNNNNIY